MKRTNYWPDNDADCVLFLQNIATKMANYVTALAITGPDQSFINLAAALAQSVVMYQDQAKKFSKDWSAMKKTVFSGNPADPLPAWPKWNGPDTAPIGLASGIERRVRVIVRRWKAAPGYTQAIGLDLGIVGEEINIDPAIAQPDLSVRMNGGRPEIDWNKQHMEALELEVDRGAGPQLLTIVTSGSTVDEHPLPGPGQSAVWTYRAIYRLNNQRVGLWSDPVQIAVKAA